jgi:hypothetical protein
MVRPAELPTPSTDTLGRLVAAQDANIEGAGPITLVLATLVHSRSVESDRKAARRPCGGCYIDVVRTSDDFEDRHLTTPETRLRHGQHSDE